MFVPFALQLPVKSNRQRRMQQRRDERLAGLLTLDQFYHKGGVEQAVLRPRRGALRVGVDGEHVGALPEMCAVHGEFAELL